MRGARPSAELERRLRESASFAPGSHIVAAISGGPDSVALAVLLDRLAGDLAVDLTLAHVNHGVRASAAQDECVVLSIAARLGRPLRVAHLSGIDADEASLRRARYGALAAMARSAGAAAVATAHTAEDQTETVLLALFRGTGVRGLTGMPPARELEAGISLVRPLLGATHAELAAEVQRSGLPYARDPTNRDCGRARNAVRAVLAELRPAFPRLDRAVARCAQILSDEASGTERARRRRLVRTILEHAGESYDIPFERVEAAAALDADRRPRRIYVKPGIELAVEENLESARVIRTRD